MRFFTLLQEKVGRYPYVKGWFLKRMITDYPLVMNIDITNHCNINCAFCPREYLRKTKGLMDIGLYRKIIDNISDDQRRVHLFLHNFGEPLLHPHLIEMITYASEKGIARSIKFSTNGLLLKGSLAESLIDANVDEITVSIDAVSEESYRELKGDHLELVEENVKAFMKLRKAKGKSKPHIRAKMMVKRDDDYEVKSFLKRWHALADSAIIDWYSNYGGLLANDGIEERSKRYACASLWYSLVVGWDGIVVPCCVDINDSFPIGDLTKDTIVDVWNNGKVEHIRSAHLNNNWEDISLCEKCTDWQFMPNIENWLKQNK